MEMTVEWLEMRCVAAVAAVSGTLLEAEPNDTSDQAVNLGNLSDAASVEAVGAIGNSVSAAADVDWFRFLLTRPRSVTLRTFSDGGSDANLLTLFIEDSEDDLANRLLAQEGEATISHALAAGEYYVAVRAGNRPLSAGDYRLVLTAQDHGFDESSSFAVRAAETALGAGADSSLSAIRTDFSATRPSSATVTEEPEQSTSIVSHPFGGGGGLAADGNTADSLPAPADHLSATPDLVLPGEIAPSPEPAWEQALSTLFGAMPQSPAQSTTGGSDGFWEQVMEVLSNGAVLGGLPLDPLTNPHLTEEPVPGPFRNEPVFEEAATNDGLGPWFGKPLWAAAAAAVAAATFIAYQKRNRGSATKV